MSEMVPERWEEIRLKELFELNTKSVVPNDFPNEKFTYFSLPAFDAFGSSIEVQGNEIESNKFDINEDSILVSKLNPRKPRVMFAQPKELRACSSTEFMSYVPKNPSSVSLKYFTQYFLSNLFQRRLELVATGSTNSHVRVSPTETTRWKIAVPPLPEQKKIASILTSVDEVIETTQKQIDKLQDLKKATMNELLTKGIGHTEFKDSELGRIPKSWSVKRLDEVAINHDSQRVPIKSEDRQNIQGIYRYYGASGIIDYVENYIFDGRYILLGEDGENVLSRNLPLAFIVEGKFWVNNHAHILQPNEQMDIGFLCEYLESLDYKNIASGSAQPKITKSALNDIRVKIPPRDEQDEIVKMLSSMDETLKSIKEKLAQTQSLKKCLMQDLLTGKVRVQVN